MRMPLAAVSKDCNLFAPENTEIGVSIIIDLHSLILLSGYAFNMPIGYPQVKPIGRKSDTYKPK